MHGALRRTQVVQRGVVSSANAVMTLAAASNRNMKTLSLWSAANNLLPLATMRRTVDGRSRDSHLRSSCFLPQSYTLTAPAMPTMRCSLKPHSAVGISFIAVTWISTSLPSTTRYLPTRVSEIEKKKKKKLNACSEKTGRECGNGEGSGWRTF